VLFRAKAHLLAQKLLNVDHAVFARQMKARINKVPLLGVKSSFPCEKRSAENDNHSADSQFIIEPESFGRIWNFPYFCCPRHPMPLTSEAIDL
jgi:hypothetical protein